MPSVDFAELHTWRALGGFPSLFFPSLNTSPFAARAGSPLNPALGSIVNGVWWVRKLLEALPGLDCQVAP